MKFETIQTYRSPRWIVLYISVAMMALGWFAAHVFDYLSRRFPPTGVRNSMDGTFDPEAILCILMFFVGMFLCLVSGLWILVAAIFHEKHPKKV